LRAAPSIVVATGHYRNGVLLSPMTAEIVSKLLLDDVVDPVIAQLRPDRTIQGVKI
jgi:glycine oxidase